MGYLVNDNEEKNGFYARIKDSVNKHNLSIKGETPSDDWQEKIPVGNYFLSDARIGDIFYMNIAKPFDEKKWLKCSVTHIRSGVVFFNTEKIGEFDDIFRIRQDGTIETYSEKERFLTESDGINRCGHLYKNSVYVSSKNRDRFIPYCCCPHTKIIEIDREPEFNFLEISSCD